MEYKTESGVALTDEMLDEMAREYEDGTWSGHGKVSADELVGDEAEQAE